MGGSSWAACEDERTRQRALRVARWAGSGRAIEQLSYLDKVGFGSMPW